MRSYELVLVLRPKLTEVDQKKLVDAIKGWLGALKITKEEDLGTKVLAYPIKREASGLYLNLVLEGENVPENLEKKIKTNDNILRHLLLRSK
ncbi:MAG: 30S ribosomal protein S6 [Candidatus Levybacteria bacterium]|nr:30S ribosomal protein S6 [Candidatus Levybacteria bacterium]